MNERMNEYRPATMHSVTDRWPDKQTDDSVMANGNRRSYGVQYDRLKYVLMLYAQKYVHLK